MSRDTIKEHVRAGKLPCVNTGTKKRKFLRFADGDFELLFAKQQVKEDRRVCFKTPRSPFWQIEFWVGDRRIQCSARTRNKKEAEALEEKLRETAEAEAKTLALSGEGRMTLDLAAGRFWSEVGQRHKDSAKTKRDFARLLEFFGKDKWLHEITDADVAAIVTWRAKQAVKGKKATKDKPVPKVAPATINRSVLEPLRKIMTPASKGLALPLAEGAQLERASPEGVGGAVSRVA